MLLTTWWGCAVCKNIVWKRTRGQEDKIIHHRREKSNLLLSHYAIENTLLLLACMNFEYEPNSGARCTAKTTTDDVHVDRYCAQNIMWSVLTLVCHFHFSSHAKAKARVKDTDECRRANTTRPDSSQAPTISRWPITRVISQQTLEFLTMSAFNCEPQTCFQNQTISILRFD